MEMIDPSEPAYAEPQRQVQRWLGRCMLSLQQSERLLKALLHDAEMTATRSSRGGEGAGAFDVRRVFEKERLATMTLGSLVSAFFGDVVSDIDAPAGTRKERDMPDDCLSMWFSFRLSIPSQHFEALQTSMRHMVSLRNEWVHHLVERFDLTSVDGCAQALEHLQAGYEKAESFRLELQGIAKGMVEARDRIAAFMTSPQGGAFCLTGKVPVQLTPLPEAFHTAMHAATPATDGTVLLSDVLEHLQSSHPNEKPGNYGYASWPQVIHESRVFRMVRRDAAGRKIPPRVRFAGDSSNGE